MKVKVTFTVNVPRESLAALRELAAAEDNTGAAEFVRLEAREYIFDYLNNNGVGGVTTTEA